MPRLPQRALLPRFASLAGVALAAWPLHADPLSPPVSQPAPQRNACFGISADIGQLLPGSPIPFAVVGSYLRSSATVTNAGAIFVLRWSGPKLGWVQEAQLFPPAAVPNTYFGRSVAALQAPGRGDFAFAGAYRDSLQGPARGAVQIFGKPPGGAWASLQSIRPGIGGVDNEWFGFSIDAGHVNATSTDTLLVGAPGGRASGTATSNGVAYIFERRVGGWTSVRKFGGAGVGTDTNRFGWSVALLGNVVTLPGDAATAARKLAIIGSPGNAVDRGQVHVFEAAAGATWATAVERIRRVPNLNPGDRYGETVAAAKRFMAVAAPGRGEGRGTVFIWERTGVNAMQPVLALQPEDLLPGDRFGSSLAMAEQPDGSVLLVVGVRGDDTLGTDTGAVRVYRWAAGSPGPEWVPLPKLLPPTPQAGAQFGFSVAAGSDPSGAGQLLLGSPFHNTTPILFNSGLLDAATLP